VLLCNDCNQPVGKERVSFAVAGNKVVVGNGENVCTRCTELRIQKLNHHTEL
jgi:tRNA(Ile)-lysidine synthase TilS/MesJ